MALTVQKPDGTVIQDKGILLNTDSVRITASGCTQANSYRIRVLRWNAATGQWESIYDNAQVSNTATVALPSGNTGLGQYHVDASFANGGTNGYGAITFFKETISFNSPTVTSNPAASALSWSVTRVHYADNPALNFFVNPLKFSVRLGEREYNPDRDLDIYIQSKQVPYNITVDEVSVQPGTCPATGPDTLPASPSPLTNYGFEQFQDYPEPYWTGSRKPAGWLCDKISSAQGSCSWITHGRVGTSDSSGDPDNPRHAGRLTTQTTTTPYAGQLQISHPAIANYVPGTRYCVSAWIKQGTANTAGLEIGLKPSAVAGITEAKQAAITQVQPITSWQFVKGEIVYTGGVNRGTCVNPDCQGYIKRYDGSYTFRNLPAGGTYPWGIAVQEASNPSSYTPAPANYAFSLSPRDIETGITRFNYVSGNIFVDDDESQRKETGEQNYTQGPSSLEVRPAIAQPTPAIVMPESRGTTDSSLQTQYKLYYPQLNQFGSIEWFTERGTTVWRNARSDDTLFKIENSKTSYYSTYRDLAIMTPGNDGFGGKTTPVSQWRSAINADILITASFTRWGSGSGTPRFGMYKNGLLPTNALWTVLGTSRGQTYSKNSITSVRPGDTISVAVDSETDANPGSSQVTFSIALYPAGTLKSTISTNGQYVLQGLQQGSYDVIYRSLPAGYQLTYPRSGLVSQSVNVGSSCSENSPDASCTPEGDVQNLNFGIIDRTGAAGGTPNAWIQGTGGDMRLDAGFVNPVPQSVPAATRFTSLAGSGGTPGVLYSADSNANFCTGSETPPCQDRASSTQWVVGPLSSSALGTPGFRTSSGLRTAYNNLLSSASQKGIPVTPLVDPENARCGTGGTADCTLSATLPSGVYSVNGNLSLNSYTFAAGQYVFLVNGTLTVKGNVLVPKGSSAVFSASQNIVIDKSVGNATISTECNPNATPTNCNLEGFYSADRQIIVDANPVPLSGSKCPTGSDIRLHVAGALIANAQFNTVAGTEWFENRRDLCTRNRQYPSVSFYERPDFLLNAPVAVRSANTISQEVAP